MGWARLDDGWHDHPKVIEAGCEAAGLWAMCLTWAHANRRDNCTPGHIPTAVAARFAGTRHRKLTATLLRVGLFDPAEDGWVVHDFTAYLPKYDPKQASAAGKAGARKRWGKGGAPPPDDPPADSEPLYEPPSKPPDGSPPDRVADGSQTYGTRASARRNPEPVTRPQLQLPAEQDRDRRALVDAHEDHAHSAAGELTQHYARLMPLADHGQATRTIAQALDGGYDPALIRAGLEQLAALNRTCTPNQLLRAIAGPPDSDHSAGAVGPKPSTTDARVQDHFDLAAQMRAERLAVETPTAPLRALPGGAA